MWLFILTTAQKKKYDINIMIFWHFSFEQLQSVTSDQTILFLQHFKASVIFFVFDNCIHKIFWLYITELQQRMLVKRQQIKVWLACKQKSFLLCFMYVKYKTTLVKNTTLYFVESLIQRTHNAESYSQTIYENLSKSTLIRKALSEFRSIKNSFLSWLEVLICYLLYYISLRVWYKALTVSRLLWHTHFESLL